MLTCKQVCKACVNELVCVLHVACVFMCAYVARYSGMCIYIYLFPNVEAKDRYACVISLNVQACVGV